MGWAARANKKKKEAAPEESVKKMTLGEKPPKHRATPPRRLDLPRKLLR